MRKLFFILIILSTLIFTSCVTLQKDVDTPLITKHIYNANFSQYLQFNIKIRSIEINGNLFVLDKPENEFFVDKDIIKSSDSLNLKYIDEYGRSWKETVTKKYPEFQMFFWGGGDNNLTYYPNFLENDIDEVRNAVKNSNSDMIVNVIADFNNQPDKVYNIYSIDGHFYETQENPYYSSNGEINSGDIRLLQKYLFTLMSRSGSTIKYLDIWNHGNGWIDERNYDDTYSTYTLKQIVTDKTSNDSSLKIKEITQLLINFQQEFGYKIDVFGTDACDMAFIEIIYEFADYVNYYVGSVNEEPGNGWDYEFLKDFNGNIEDLLKKQVYYYSNSYKSDTYNDFYFYDNSIYAITFLALRTQGINNNIKDYIYNNLVNADYSDYTTPYIANYNRLLDINLVISDYSDFNDQFVVSKSVESEDILLNEYKYNDINYLSGLGISYKIDNAVLPDYMELQFYKDFIDSGKWSFSTF